MRDCGAPSNWFNGCRGANKDRRCSFCRRIMSGNIDISLRFLLETGTTCAGATNAKIAQTEENFAHDWSPSNWEFFLDTGGYCARFLFTSYEQKKCFYFCHLWELIWCHHYLQLLKTLGHGEFATLSNFAGLANNRSCQKCAWWKGQMQLFFVWDENITLF